MIADLLSWVETFSGSPWFYLVIFIVCVGDSVVPVLPSETMVIIGGVSAGAGDLRLSLVIGIAAVGAWIGDNTAYLVGRRAGPWLERRLVSRPKTAKRFAFATEQLRKRGFSLLFTARFVPGGRTAITVASGLSRQPWPPFGAALVPAALMWALYGSLLGYFFGQRFQDNHTLAFFLAMGAALAFTGLLEVVRWRRNVAARRRGA